MRLQRPRKDLVPWPLRRRLNDDGALARPSQALKTSALAIMRVDDLTKVLSSPSCKSVNYDAITKKEDLMILKVFCIRDAKAEVFNTPFFQKTHGEAERNFRSIVNDDKSTVHKYPEDFDLYFLGEYDDNTGKMQPVDTPQHVIKAVQCVESSGLKAVQ